MTTTRRHPWRVVTAVSEHDQRVSIFTPGGRTARYWELDLTCRHTVSRLIRRARQVTPGLTGQRNRPDLPPPRRVRCDQCPREAAGE